MKAIHKATLFNHAANDDDIGTLSFDDAVLHLEKLGWDSEILQWAVPRGIYKKRSRPGQTFLIREIINRVPDEEVPVIMRGKWSEVLDTICGYGGYSPVKYLAGITVYERWLQRHKFSAFSQSEAEKIYTRFFKLCESKPEKRSRYITKHNASEIRRIPYCFCFDGSHGQMVIYGNHVYTSRDQLQCIKALRRHEQKLKNIESAIMRIKES